MKLQNEIIVKRYEEDLGEKYFKVLVPNAVEKEEVMKNLQMAAKYSQVDVMDFVCFDEEERAEYDEYLEEMGIMRNCCNGDEVFEHYLTKICGYGVVDMSKPKVDFEFEW